MGFGAAALRVLRLTRVMIPTATVVVRHRCVAHPKAELTAEVEGGLVIGGSGRGWGQQWSNVFFYLFLFFPKIYQAGAAVDARRWQEGQRLQLLLICCSRQHARYCKVFVPMLTWFFKAEDAPEARCSSLVLFVERGVCVACAWHRAPRWRAATEAQPRQSLLPRLLFCTWDVIAQTVKYKNSQTSCHTGRSLALVVLSELV